MISLERLGVCSWSLQPTDPGHLLQQLQQIGLNRVQLALDPLRKEPAVWGEFGERASQAGVQLISGMFGCVGEDYSTMDAIRRTGGIVPDATWPENWKNIQESAQIASSLGLHLVTFHAGFMPHDPAEPGFSKLLERLRQVADVFAKHGLDLGLETGQETAEALDAFLQKLDRPNVGVNFDPANMILYDKGRPLEALRLLKPWLKQCHIKDARRTKVPGTWGEEVAAGEGEVDWLEFFAELRRQGFHGALAIEREAGGQRIADIKAARQLVERLVSV